MPVLRKETRVVLQTDSASEQISRRTIDYFNPVEINIAEIDPLEGPEEPLQVYTQAIRHSMRVEGHVPEVLVPTIQKVIDSADEAWIAKIRWGGSFFQMGKYLINSLNTEAVDEILRMNGEGRGQGERYYGRYRPATTTLTSGSVRANAHAFLYAAPESTLTAATIRLTIGANNYDASFTIPRRPFIGLVDFNAPPGVIASASLHSRTPSNATNTHIRWGIGYPMTLE